MTVKYSSMKTSDYFCNDYQLSERDTNCKFRNILQMKLILKQLPSDSQNTLGVVKIFKGNDLFSFHMSQLNAATRILKNFQDTKICKMEKKI